MNGDLQPGPAFIGGALTALSPVEEHGEREDARVAGYGLAFADRADVNSVEGDFHLNSRSAATALQVFDISTGDEGVRRLHLVWLD